MARARNIKPGVCKNRKLAKLSPHARILFRDLPMFADHEGRLLDCHETIKAEIFAFEHDLEVDLLLKELHDSHFIVRYECHPLSGQDPFESRFIWIVNFTKHQNPHKNERVTPSKYPIYDIKTNIRDNNGTAQDIDGITRADSLIPHPSSPIPQTDSGQAPAPAEDKSLMKPKPKEIKSPDFETIDSILQKFSAMLYPTSINSATRSFVVELLKNKTKAEIFEAINIQEQHYITEDTPQRFRKRYKTFFELGHINLLLSGELKAQSPRKASEKPEHKNVIFAKKLLAEAKEKEKNG